MSVKVRWEQWCRWNCDLRVINARKQAFSVVPKASPWRFEANSIWYSAIKFTKSHSAKCSLHKWAWLRRSIKVSSFELYKFDPFSPHSGSIPRELVHSYALGCLWVVTVCCNTVGRHGRAFCRPHSYTFDEQSKMATALTPQTDVTSEKSHVTDGEPETAVSASLQKIISLKTNIKFFVHFLFH